LHERHVGAEHRRRQDQRVDWAPPCRDRRVEPAGDEARRDRAAQAVAEQDQRRSEPAAGTDRIENGCEVVQQVIATA
jgi:hypothetical protein